MAVQKPSGKLINRDLVIAGDIYTYDPASNSGAISKVIEKEGNIVAPIELDAGEELVDANGNELLEFTTTASAVNHVGMANAATGNNPVISCEGEANTGITFQNSEDEEVLILNSVATSVNEITISSAATGNNPIIACTGEADTGIDFENSEGEEILILDSVATSVNELTVRSAATGNKPIIAATGEADNGIEFHNDQAEEILILASAATSVNEVTVTSAATAGAPKIEATGGDTNIDLALDAKGTGNVDIQLPIKYSSVQTVTTAEAVSLITSLTYIASTGADALTLADGVVGQEKFIVMTSDGGDATLTPTNLTNGSTLTFDDVGDSAHLVFMNDGWVSMGGTATLA